MSLFPPDQIFCVLDYETRSKADIKLCGGFEYANHPSTKILCIAWRIGTFEELKKGTTETKVWSPAIPSSYGELKRALLDPRIILVAHNAFFEQVITRYVLPRIINAPELKTIPSSRWVCTASMARALAFPGKLEKACAALKLPVQKDKEGHRLMLKMSQPRKPTKKNPAIWHNKKSDLIRLMQYCVTDVDAEVCIFTSVPMLSAHEREIWLLDQKINFRGFAVDRELVKKIQGMIAIELKRFERETQELTGGKIQSTAQRDAVLAWVRKQGVDIENLQKKTIEDALSSGLATGPGAALLKLRLESAKASTAKYEAFEMRSRTDGRVRDSLVYHTASTGRWGGSGVQPHNFPRETLEEMDLVPGILLEPDTDLEKINLFWGNPLDLFSKTLRSCIVASPGKELFVGDFAGVEVRKLFWMAKHARGLEAFFQNRDLYCEQASVIYGRKITKENKFERQLGKKVVLGAGFGLGKDRFFDSCKKDGMEVTTELAEQAVLAYRRTHYPIPKMWANLQMAAIAAVKNPGKRYTINRTRWWLDGKYLYCELPSGRRITYYGPEIRLKATSWGELKPTLYHWDIHPKTKEWVFRATWGGVLTENVVQGSSRCLMAAAMQRLEAAGYEVILTVHDEIIAEREIGKGSLKEFLAIMAEVTGWADGMPIAVEGFTGLRYKK